MITNTLELRMTPGGISPFTHVSQYETGARTFEFRLYSLRCRGEQTACGRVCRYDCLRGEG